MRRLLNAWERHWARRTREYIERHPAPFTTSAVTTRRTP